MTQYTAWGLHDSIILAFDYKPSLNVCWYKALLIIPSSSKAFAPDVEVSEMVATEASV